MSHARVGVSGGAGAVVALGMLVALAAPGRLNAQTPASGAFFATVRRTEGTVTTASTLRSDDGGETWRPVEVPPGAGAVRVDPTDHAVMYAVSQEGLHRSADEGASWERILPGPGSPSASFSGFA